MQAILELCARVEAIGGHSVREGVQEVRDQLSAPLRIAVVGQVKAGKSTLVNALIGKCVAATDDAECTSVVTHYVFDPPERAELVLQGGRVMPVALSGSGLPDELPADPSHLDHAVVRLADERLVHYSLVDTPGIGTTTPGNAERTRRAVLGSLEAPALADAVIYVFRDDQFAADVDFLRERRVATAGSTRAATLGVLSHADGFGAGPWGAEDPIPRARIRAAEIAADRVAELTSVVAIAGRLAESASTGRIREADAAILRALAGAGDSMLAAGLAPDGIEEARIERLAELLGDYGVRLGRSHSSNAAELNRWAADVSGIRSLRSLIDSTFVQRHSRLKIKHAVERLYAVARRSSAAMRMVREVSDAESDPRLGSLREILAWERMTAAYHDHPLATMLTDLLRTGEAGRVGLGDDAAAADVRRAADDRAARALAMTRDVDPVVSDAARVVSRSYAAIALGR
ncbi:MAG: dynamin family protein [Actinomycetota bacterium]